MHRPHRIHLIALAVIAGVAAAAIATSAGAAGRSVSAWTRISGPTQPGAQLGLARTADGLLHVIWNRGTPSTSIFETRLSAAGKAIGTSTVASSFGGNGGLAVLVMPDKTLRLFAAGSPTPTSSASGINTFTAPAGGRTWTLDNGVVWGGPVAGSSAVIGATLTKDGQVVTGWRGAAAEGLPPSSIPQNAYAPFQLATHLATDAASGAVVLSGVYGGGKGGVFVQQILPSPGRAVVLPLPYGNQDRNTSASGRMGAPGVYVAYADTKAIRLYRYAGSSKTLAAGPYTSAAVCAGPDGRLWVSWGDDKDELFVTRSNRAAGAFEPVQKLTLPQNTTNGLNFVQCEGSAGPLDLFANVADKANQLGFWHTHVLPVLSLRASVTHTKAGPKVSFSVRDAGDPVAGATITVGGKRSKTDSKGQASVALRPGSYSAGATAPGYAPASAKLSVR
jgi:Carboxypeptidase regulatory-like domain